MSKYISLKLLFSEPEETFENFKKQNMHEYLIRKNFTYDKEFNQYSYEDDKVRIYYNLNDSYITVFDDTPGRMRCFGYNLLSKKLSLNLIYINPKVDDYTFYIKNLKKLNDEEYEIYSEFKENYLDVYFPFL